MLKHTNQKIFNVSFLYLAQSPGNPNATFIFLNYYHKYFTVQGQNQPKWQHFLFKVSATYLPSNIAQYVSYRNQIFMEK